MLQFMPDNVPLHYDIAGNIDRWGSKYEELIFPVIILGMSLFWTLLIAFYEKKAKNTADEKERAGVLSNIKVISIAGMAMAAMFTVMQGFILFGSYNEAASNATRSSVDIGKISCILLGIVLIAIGNVMPKTRINGSVGVRVTWSMYNDTTWRKSNRFGGYALMIAGVLTVMEAAVMPNSFWANTVMIVLLIGASMVTLIYAHKVYTIEIENEKKGK